MSISITPKDLLLSFPGSSPCFHGEQSSDICQNWLFYLLNIIKGMWQCIFFGGWLLLLDTVNDNSCNMLQVSINFFFLVSILLCKYNQLKKNFFWNNFKQKYRKVAKNYFNFPYALHPIWSPFLTFPDDKTVKFL